MDCEVVHSKSEVHVMSCKELMLMFGNSSKKYALEGNANAAKEGARRAVTYYLDRENLLSRAPRDIKFWRALLLDNIRRNDPEVAACAKILFRIGKNYLDNI